MAGDYYFAGSDERIFRFCAEENASCCLSSARDQLERKFSLLEHCKNLIALAGMFWLGAWAATIVLRGKDLQCARASPGHCRVQGLSKRTTSPGHGSNLFLLIPVARI